MKYTTKQRQVDVFKYKPGMEDGHKSPAVGQAGTPFLTTPAGNIKLNNKSIIVIHADGYKEVLTQHQLDFRFYKTPVSNKDEDARKAGL